MAEFEAKVYRLEIEEHPNADRLELARVGDYRSIVLKDQFSTGDLGVYIPTGAVVPIWLLKRLGLWDDEKGKGKLAGKELNIREGIVIKPCKERGNSELGRVILKSVSEGYLLRKGGTEFN